jgi:DNA-binding CsgD family transcriptional regulator
VALPETREMLVGRERELADVNGFLDNLGSDPPGLVLEGDQGIGKTTLWEAGVAIARERSYRVLIARPVGAEAQLSFSALNDLLADVLGESLASLPAPQRRALATALLLDDPAGPPPEERAIAIAMLGVLQRLADDAPVVVAVDDLQWLDRPTASVLTYALRRLRGTRVALFATTRRDQTQEAAPIGEHPAGTPGTARLEVGPLSVGALRRLLAVRVGASLSRPLLLRVHEITEGNPFYALELAQVLETTVLEPGAALPIPPTLHALLSARLEVLSQRTREMLLALSALGEADVQTLVAALPRRTGVGPRLREAVAAGVVAVEAERVRFAHPLLASVVYSSVEASTLRRIHRRLAGVVGDPEQRARHLALSAAGPDETVAAALDDGASHAAARGASAAAAELLELAIRLTPEQAGNERHRRMAAAARHHTAYGEMRRAAHLLEQLTNELPAGSERTDALLLLLETVEDEGGLALRLSERALAEAGSDTHRASNVHAFLSRYWTMRGDNARALASARAALVLAEQGGDERALLASATHLARAETRTAQLIPGLLERALVLEPADGQRILDSPRLALAHLRLFQGRLSEARRLCEQLLAETAARGDDSSAANLHGVLGYVECAAGNWSRAAKHALAAVEYTEQVFGDDSPGMAQELVVKAHVAAHIGAAVEAIRTAKRAAAIAEEAEMDIVAFRSRAVIGFVELSIGNYTAAAVELTPVVDKLLARGFAIAPHPLSIEPLEALIAAGDLERARPLLQRYLNEARAIESPMLLAAGERCRGLLATGERDLAAARKSFETALAAQQQSEWPFELGRTLLAAGRVERRAKQKRAARQSLTGALAIFDRLGARLWADQTQAELGRIGGRAPSTGELTPAEARVAALIAAGRTNREAAAELHLSEHTVEGHLSRIYTKLGLRSRSELARHLLISQQRDPHDE